MYNRNIVLYNMHIFMYIREHKRTTITTIVIIIVIIIISHAYIICVYLLGGFRSRATNDSYTPLIVAHTDNDQKRRPPADVFRSERARAIAGHESLGDQMFFFTWPTHISAVHLVELSALTHARTHKHITTIVHFNVYYPLVCVVIMNA